MDIDLARHAIRAGFRAGRELENLMHVLKAACPPPEYKPYALAIAAAIHEIQEATLKPALKQYPELEAEIEDSIAKYGRYL